MATKEEVLGYIKQISSQKLISREEMLKAYDDAQGVKSYNVFSRKVGIAEILYYIGGAIIFLGIVILVGQNWTTMSETTRMLVTFGSGVVAYLVGLFFSRDERTGGVGVAFFLVSALVLPLGIFVVFDNFGMDTSSWGSQSLVSAILLVVFLLSEWLLKKGVFTLFSIIFGTWLYFSFTNFLIGDNQIYFDDFNFFAYRALVAGAAYILLGYYFSKGERAGLTGFLYGFGILGFLGAAMALGGYYPEQNVFWELIFPGLALGTVFLSVPLQSKSFLTFGTISLMAYILKITAEYFSTGLGWPIALMFAGLMLIGVGYMSVYIKRKYITS